MGNEMENTCYGLMSVALNKAKLIDLCVDRSGIQTGPFGSLLHKDEYTNEGTPIITVEHLIDNSIITDSKTPCVSKEDEKRLSKFQLRQGDIVFSRVGSVDRRAYVSAREEGWLFSGRCLRVRVNKEKIYPQYLSYLFGFEGFKKYIRSIAVGATMPSINTKILQDIDIFYPDYDQQVLIGDYLGLLEQKITLNREINQILEKMAQELFKSWFVDFDPAIDNALDAGNPIPTALQKKADARQAMRARADSTPLPDDIRKLFPSEFEESELGWIPKGWKYSIIGDEVSVVGGGTPSTKIPEFWENGTVQWTTPKDMSNLANKILIETDRCITAAGLKQISSGLLPLNTVLMSSRAPVGYLALAKIPVAINQGYIAMKCNKKLSPEYVLQWCHFNMDEIKQRASGTTFAEISKASFKPIPILLPNDTVISHFTNHLNSIYATAECFAKEIKELSGIRDLLLPKLISGEINLASLVGE